MAFENCKNCNAQIHCGCQYQLASDGKNCCDDCIDEYEETIKVIPLSEFFEEQKINNEKHDELSNRTNDETNDEESEIL